MERKLSGRFWCAMTLFGLIGQIAWVVENMYFNVFIYKMFHATAEDISLMVAASAVAATLTTVFMGALSDRVGKRKLFICGGYLLWGVSIFSFVFLRLDVIEAIFPMTVSAAATGVSLTIALDCLMTFFGSTANDAAFNAWLTDSVDESSRGRVEGINAMMPLVAMLAVFGGFMGFDLEQSASWTVIFSIIGGVTFLIGLLGLFLIQEPALKKESSGYFSTIFYGFRPSTMARTPKLYLALLVFALFNISIQIFMPYLILYYEVSLKMENYVLIMAPAVILASVVTALWGKVYDKKGFATAIGVPMAWLAAGYGLLYFCRGTALVFLGSLLMMCGYLSGMAVIGALIRTSTPEGKSGRFQGLRIFCQVLIPGVIGPGIGAGVLAGAEQIVGNDGTSSFVPNANIFLAALVALVVMLPALVCLLRHLRPRLQSLDTPWMEQAEVPWNVYPRPQMRRETFLCLNGRWSLSCMGRDWGDVLVPYPPESRLSGVERTPGKGQIMIYRRIFELPEAYQGKRVLLHFGAVDQQCRVWVNGREAGGHEGGYLPFHFDVTELLQPGDNEIRVGVRDDLDPDYPYGKQRKKRGGMWYTPISGIWQTVWLEPVPEVYLRSLRITPTLNEVTLELEGGAEEKRLELAGKCYTFKGNRFVLKIDQPRLWTPEDPYLYEFTLSSGEDCVTSYFALRTVGVRQGQILLNGKPRFFHGLLDQGYFSDGIYLPGAPEGYTYDVKKMKELGFDVLRKHIKIEPEQFYYDCDRLGMIVFQDLVNSGAYRFLRDTALPTLGRKQGVKGKVTERRRKIFEASALQTLAHLYNHPCVCYYTIFNEGWGQFEGTALYRMLRKVDPTRIYDTASGWFYGDESDVLSEHVYFKPIKLTGDRAHPLALTEFGGYSCRIEGHLANEKKAYGYRTMANPEALQKALEDLYYGQILPAIDQGLFVAIYTQVSDVEDEINGLVTYDRQVCKVDPQRMQAIAGRLKAAFQEKYS